MEATDLQALKELLIKVKNLKVYDYSEARYLTDQFKELGKKCSNPYATEEYDKIRVYFDRSEKFKDQRKKSTEWSHATNILFENIELIVQRNS